MKAIHLTVQRHYRPLLVYSLVALLIMLPLLGRGYILTLDMVFVPTLRVPETMSSSFLFHTLLAAIGTVLPSDIIQKILLFGILIFSALGAHRLLAAISPPKKGEPAWGYYLAGIFYMVNPYTYTRFAAGQYAVLMGYALLPFFARTLLALWAAPRLRTALVAGLWAVVISIASVHTVGLMMVLAATTTIVCGWRHRHRSGHTAAGLKYTALGVAAWLLASFYWLVPFVTGTSDTARGIAQFGTADLTAFATSGHGVAGKLLNILRLEGFWADDRGVYVMPAGHMLGWGLIAAVVWALIIVGAVSLWRSRKRAETLIFGLSATGAAILALGSFSSWLMNILTWFAGYREPHKFVGLVALAYALFIGQGLTTIVRWQLSRKHTLRASAVAGILLLLPLAFTPTMIWGLNGQLRPRHYPPDWFAMDKRLQQEQTDARTLFLPWHLYMRFSFAGRGIASPAADFFATPVIASDDPEFGGVAPSVPDPAKRTIGKLLTDAPDANDLGAKLAPLDIKYILLLKDYDAAQYDYLNRQTDLSLEHESDTLKLYRNHAHQEQP